MFCRTWCLSNPFATDHTIISLFGDGKIATASIDERENFITAEVGRRAYALNKSILALIGRDSASFIWEPMFQIWQRLP